MPDPYAIDINIFVGGLRVYESKYFSADGNDTLANAVQFVVAERARHMLLEDESKEEDELIESMISTITSIKCVGKPNRELQSFLQRNNFPLRCLHSASTPILDDGINITLALPDKIPARKPTKTVNALLMNKDEGDRKYLPRPAEIANARLDKQILNRLYILCTEGLGLGFYHKSQRDCLESNLKLVGGVLCFVEKYWTKLLKTSFPAIPREHSTSQLLQLVSLCSRERPKAVPLKVQTVATHMATLANLTWSPYKKSVSFAPALESMKLEISVIYGILIEKKRDMTLDNNPFTSNESRPGMSQFEKVPDYVVLDSETEEFFVPIRPASPNQKKKPGRKTEIKVAIQVAVKNLCQRLQHQNFYDPYHLTDEAMGICDAAYLSRGGVVELDSSERAYHRQQFREALTKGLPGIGMNLFGRKNGGGTYPAYLCVWKVPLVSDGQSEGKVAKAIADCRKVMPKRISKEALKCFNNIIKGIAEVDSGTLQALTNYLFMGEVNAKGNLANEYCQFIVDLAQGNDVDASFMIDGRSFNSRGGKGIYVCAHFEPSICHLDS